MYIRHGLQCIDHITDDNGDLIDFQSVKVIIKARIKTFVKVNRHKGILL